MVGTNLYTFFDTFFDSGDLPNIGITSSSKPHNVYFDKKEQKITFEVAAQNVEKDNISVKGKNQVLIIDIDPPKEKTNADIEYIVNKLCKSRIHLEYTLHDKFDMNKVDVKLSKGILYVTIPVRPEMKPKEHTYKIS
jgi:HSP20 family molecular chaperone IbpA